jgi:hypothetical protein
VEGGRPHRQRQDYEAFLTAATEYPLHFAVACGDAEWAGDLLKAGRTPQDPDLEGTTPTDLLGRPGNDQSDQVIRAHNRSKLFDELLPAANAWKPPEGGFGADAKRQVGAAMKAQGEKGKPEASNPTTVLTWKKKGGKSRLLLFNSLARF